MLILTIISQRRGNKAEGDKTEERKCHDEKCCQVVTNDQLTKRACFIPLEETMKIKIYGARCHDSTYCCALAICLLNIEVACS
jgi:hypothetical protein